MTKKKIRGLSRKTEAITRRLKQETEHFPAEFYNGFWHLHLPADYNFITSKKVPRKVKRQCIQTLIDRAAHLISCKPDGPEKYYVFVSADLPALWNAQIIIFEGAANFEGFFTRDNEYQKWIPLPENRNLKEEWALAVPEKMQVSGYKEILADETGASSEGEIWFFGELGEE
ncbi:DUF3916 domain-containing protein [Evansella clarkii]|jgi:hypothetical protein|uniref:DUF3916 domain-containing protein n=1 Tax=Evansella clarkii TaxID=79879 RepID=UPI000995E349|nr:DUF3916 domain-containing protein [Evansella clarkii]